MEQTGYGARLETAAAVVSFWLEAGGGRWFSRDAAFDAEIRARGGALHRRVAEGGLREWEGDAEGALALVLVLDQFSRNLYRDDRRAFAWDGAALCLARRAIRRGFDAGLPVEKRRWLYMPFMHSEDVSAQRCGLAYFRALGEEKTLDAAIEHAEIIERFGRFPHRNGVMGRETSDAEAAYLASGGFRG